MCMSVNVYAYVYSSLGMMAQSRAHGIDGLDDDDDLIIGGDDEDTDTQKLGSGSATRKDEGCCT
jgi:hypothetical protein